MSGADHNDQVNKDAREAATAASAGSYFPAAPVETQFYRLLRRVLVAQANGDCDIGEKFGQILNEDGEPKTAAEFDARMEAALKAMGGGT